MVSFPTAEPMSAASHMPPAVPILAPRCTEALGGEATKGYFRALDSFLAAQEGKGKKIYPPKNEIFAALSACAPGDVKVVILGQDPYHGAGQGHGLAFSVKHGVQTPPSLRNMVKEASESVGIRKPAHGNLLAWAAQGVLLLNNVLTVEAGQADSHKGRGWEAFTDAVVRHVSAKQEGVVFLLWGKPAQTKGQSVSRTKHLVICTSHPSPLGATKTASPFTGSGCFKKTNEYLVSKGKAPIDWNL